MLTITRLRVYTMYIIYDVVEHIEMKCTICVNGVAEVVLEGNCGGFFNLTDTFYINMGTSPFLHTCACVCKEG